MDRHAGLRRAAAGILAGRIGTGPILVPGMILMAIGLASLAAVSTPTVPYAP